MYYNVIAISQKVNHQYIFGKNPGVLIFLHCIYLGKKMNR